MQLTSRFTCNVVANADCLPRPTFARCAIGPTPLISSRSRLQRGPRSWQMRSQAQGSQEAAQAVAEQGSVSTSGSGGAALSLRPMADRCLLMHCSGDAAMCTTADQRHSMTAVAEDVMELEIMVQGMTCNGCTSRVQDTLQVKMQMTIRPPRRASLQASRQRLH